MVWERKIFLDKGKISLKNSFFPTVDKECTKMFQMKMNLADVEKLKTSFSHLSSLWISLHKRDEAFDSDQN